MGQGVPSCILPDWADQPWNDCNVTCGGGVQNRTRQTPEDSKRPQHDQKDCGFCHGDHPHAYNRGLDCCSLDQDKDKDPLSLDSTTCGGDIKPCSEVAHAISCARSMEEMLQERPCNTQDCGVDCTMGDWSEWSCELTTPGNCSTAILTHRRSRTTEGRSPGSTDCPEEEVTSGGPCTALPPECMTTEAPRDLSAVGEEAGHDGGPQQQPFFAGSPSMRHGSPSVFLLVLVMLLALVSHHIGGQ
ncbi:unnamed protein product [Vitrella brassicaformis CCMP3155]|uniref:Uncharacterized protein n=1 Tax=Vitrella brassicaformis (strain CCMP3155) TaxID=1169540 RepID=A0A0G4EAF4_VITBC|nr:unnamed protein product [Vitrella brassicaformis CCMP3155]|eukprot:CEL92455.1 unnamed protein product [Vitrella brassicaformis CCMP3155]